MAQDRVIRLDSKGTTYIINISRTGHLENLYYGRKLRENALTDALLQNRSIGIGTGVGYTEQNPLMFLETSCLETSTPGKGDFRSPAVLVDYSNGMTTLDFVYQGHRIVEGKPQLPNTLAQSYSETPEGQ